MKTTTTLDMIINGYLQYNGYNEFENAILYPQGYVPQLTFNKPSFSVMGKIARFDKDIQQVVTNDLFAEYVLPNPDLDLFFKKMFVNRFTSREIGYQTVDRFQQELISYVISKEQNMLAFWENNAKYYSGQVDSDNVSKTTDGQNSASQDLPQDEVDMDLHTDSLDYATDNTVSRGFANTETTGKSTQFNPDTLLKLENYWRDIMDEMDSRLFLHIW